MTASPFDVWRDLPRVSARTVELERLGAAWQGPGPLGPLFGWLGETADLCVVLDRPEVDLRGAGLARPALVAQFRLPRLGSRLGLGVEAPIAHAVVDRLLGFDRPFGEQRLQITPVEWGVWTYFITRSLEEARPNSGLSIDRVGPDPFDASGLGPIVTFRWAVKAGEAAGAVRLWIPESLVESWRSAEPPARPPSPLSPKLREASADWRAVAGVLNLTGGLSALRPGGVWPLVDPRLSGTPGAPVGPLFLVHRADAGDEYRLPIRFERGSTRAEAIVDGPILHQQSPNPESAPAMPTEADADALDAPVTLTVELGRVNIPVSRLADLKPGDVLPLNRHGREPVELTSNGRTVARGELILIDEELGLRVTSVFL